MAGLQVWSSRGWSSGPPDEKGRRAPVPIEGSTFVIECDSVIAAIGQEPETDYFGKAGLAISRKRPLR